MPVRREQHIGTPPRTRTPISRFWRPVCFQLHQRYIFNAGKDLHLTGCRFLYPLCYFKCAPLRHQAPEASTIPPLYSGADYLSTRRLTRSIPPPHLSVLCASLRNQQKTTARRLTTTDRPRGVLPTLPCPLAGAAGFEPADAGVKVLCLTAWRRPIIMPSVSGTF